MIATAVTAFGVIAVSLPAGFRPDSLVEASAILIKSGIPSTIRAFMSAGSPDLTLRVQHT